MRFICLLLVACCLGAAFPGRAQNSRPDSASRRPAAPKKVEIPKDSARIALEKLPGESLRRSLLIPGWGQVHNKRVWKVPIVYAGYVTLGIVYNFNQQNYRQTLHEVQFRQLNNGTKSDPTPLIFNATFEQLVNAKDFYRRNRDLTILGFLAMHAFQSIEAYVDAKMRRYDVTPDLSLHVGPTVQGSPVSLAMTNPVPSISIALVFK